MITTKELRRHDRPIGRKAGDLTVDFEVEGVHHRATFPLRVDVDAGQFVALDGDLQHIGETRAELVDHMRKVASSKIALTWTRYLEISYQVGVVEGPHRHNHHGLDPNDERSGPVTSIALNFEVVEYSSMLEVSSRSSIARRKIGDDGSAYDEERRWEVPKDAIPFSQERLDALRHIQSTMTAIDDRMRALFSGKAETVATRLDTITSQQLATWVLKPHTPPRELPAPEGRGDVGRAAGARKGAPREGRRTRR